MLLKIRLWKTSSGTGFQLGADFTNSRNFFIYISNSNSQWNKEVSYIEKVLAKYVRKKQFISFSTWFQKDPQSKWPSTADLDILSDVQGASFRVSQNI